MLKKIALKLLKLIPENPSVFSVLKIFHLPTKVTSHLSFTGLFTFKVNGKKNLLYSHKLLVDNRLFWGGIYYEEKLCIKIWEYFSTKNSTIIDIGANIGIFAIIAKSENANADVYAFEPSPNIFKNLKTNVEVNKYDIKCHDSALSNFDGTTEFYISDVKTLSNSFAKKTTSTGSVKVIVKKLDTFAREENIQKIGLIKLDVESFEPEVLEGMQQVIETMHPVIIMEVLKNETGEKDQKWLDGKGYSYYHIDEEKGLIPCKELIRRSRKHKNYLICKEEDAKELISYLSTVNWR